MRTIAGLAYVKAESVAGTDIINGTLTGLKPVFALVPLVYEPESDVIPRQVLDGQTLELASDHKILRGKITFTTELRGNRTDGSAYDQSSGQTSYEPECNLLLRGCDLEPTYVPETTPGARDGAIRYFLTNPSGQGTTLTFYFYYGGKLHKLTGCKGTFSLNYAAGDFVRANWEFRGIYKAVTDASLPSVSASDFPQLTPPKWQNAGAFTFGGSGICLAAMSLNLGNQLEIRHCAGQSDGFSGYLVSDRKITGEVDPEDATEATRADFARWAAASSVAFSATTGTLTGNRFSVLGNAQTASVRYDSRDGQIIKKLGLRFVRAVPGYTDSTNFYLEFA